MRAFAARTPEQHQFWSADPCGTSSWWTPAGLAHLGYEPRWAFFLGCDPLPTQNSLGDEVRGNASRPDSPRPESQGKTPVSGRACAWCFLLSLSSFVLLGGDLFFRGFLCSLLVQVSRGAWRVDLVLMRQQRVGIDLVVVDASTFDWWARSCRSIDGSMSRESQLGVDASTMGWRKWCSC